MEVYIGCPANSEKDTFEVAAARKTKAQLVILTHARDWRVSAASEEPSLPENLSDVWERPFPVYISQ